MKPARARGFTLIEVMTVVVVIGILAAVAYPSYMDYVRKGNRSAAQSFMMTIAQRQEQYLLTNRSYTTNYGSGGLNLSDPRETIGKYQFVVTQPGGTTSYLITATPQGNQAVPGKFDALTLSNDGSKAPTSEWTR